MIHLRHPGVVNLLDLFCEGGAAFLVLEHMQVLAARTLNAYKGIPGSHYRCDKTFPGTLALSRFGCRLVSQFIPPGLSALL